MKPPTVRSLCAVEGATWAAGLLHLVALDKGGIALGVADAWFDVPGIGLTLHGRRDAVSSVHSDAARVGLLRVRDGLPGKRAVEGLLVDGLVDALSAPERPVPARVVGAWPDAGMCLVVAFDDDAARSAARIVVECATRLAIVPAQRLAHPVAA